RPAVSRSRHSKPIRRACLQPTNEPGAAPRPRARSRNRRAASACEAAPRACVA
uniref:Uncharacterized protein n=1 Tax=Cucumis melo TaxID=3656 RepID=A0A9I9E3Z0_CUCME